MSNTEEKFGALALRVALGHRVKDAAKELAIPKATSYNWSRSPNFRSKVGELRGELLSQAVGKVSAAATQAIETLAEVMQDQGQKAGDRIAAAKALLTSLQGLTQLGELRDRIERIERDMGHAE
jgi:transposase